MNRFIKGRALGLALATLPFISNAELPVIEVEGGPVKGIPTATNPDVTVFRGIPYAAAPVGELRWRRPHPVIPRDTVLIADKWGKVPVQNDPSLTGYMYTREFYSDGLPESGEDCLYLNIWTPTEALTDSVAALPVAMWIHGGAYDHGWGFEPPMDGQAWAERGVILVTINYREGIFGLLNHPDLAAEDPDGVSGNYTVQDQIAALEWIYRNIGRFGGDPSRITVMGQSAGAMSVKNLVSSPKAIPMIAGAIIQSGGGIGTKYQKEQTSQELEALGKAMMDSYGLDTPDKMRKATPTEIMSIFNEKRSAPGIDGLPYRPHADGVILPEDFTTATLNGNIADIPYMIGSVSGDGEWATATVDAFCQARNSSSDKPVFLYSFERALPGDDNGAFHSSELWYMFHTLDRAWRPFTEADYRLADRMTDAWTNFVKSGTPSDDWTPYSPTNSAPHIFNVE